MAEALAAIGAVSSILQIADFATKLVAHSKELLESANGALKANIETETLARQYEDLASSITTNEWRCTINDPAEQRVVKLATDLLDESEDLLELMDSLKISTPAPGRSRMKQSVCQAARSLRKQKKVQRHCKALQELNALLATAMLEAQRSRQNEPQFRMLERLEYEGMNFRESIIKTAYSQTCEWALEQDCFGLKPWLRHGEGIFWITGQPASGKSTLMKFLCSHRETKSLLQAWGGQATVLIPKFYFWHLGTNPLHTSTEGLLRSILHSLIKNLPEVAREVLGERVKDVYADGPSLEWDEAKLLDLTRGMLTYKKQVQHQRQTKFCFFIDGLDEYNGNHLKLVKILTGLCSDPGVKMCVSSRPWNVFRRTFEKACPSLTLENLTRNDIHTYVHNELHSAFSTARSCFGAATATQLADMDDVDTVVTEIVDKAEGVFLWVYLVVQAVIRGVAEGDSTATLRLRVERFPPDLERFFDVLIFERADGFYRKQAYQALSLALQYHKTETTFSAGTVLDFWLLLQSPAGLEDDKFPCSIPILPMTEERLATMMGATRAFLSASCGHLLVLQSRGAFSDVFTKVVFLHRTVSDFLQTARMQERLANNVPPHFKNDRIIHLLNFAKVKLLQPYANRRTIHQVTTGLLQSLSKPHYDLQKGYIEDLDTVLRESLSTLTRSAARSHSTMLTEIRPILTSFQADIYNLAYLDTSDILLKTRELCEWIAAALGTHWANSFDFDECNARLLKALVVPRALTRELTKFHATPRCCTDVWLLFLGKWHSIKSVIIGPRRDRAWILAKIFLNQGARLSDRFCTTGHEHDNHEAHNWRTASDFLAEVVPQEWIDEWKKTYQPKFTDHDRFLQPRSLIEHRTVEARAFY